MKCMEASCLPGLGPTGYWVKESTQAMIVGKLYQLILPLATLLLGFYQNNFDTPYEIPHKEPTPFVKYLPRSCEP